MVVSLGKLSDKKKIPIRNLTSTVPVSPIAPQFKLRRLEDVVGRNKMVHELHRHDFYFILSVQKGSGAHIIDFISYEVRHRSVFFLRPGQVHQLTLEAGCTGYLLEFNSEFYHPQDPGSLQRFRKASNKVLCEFEETRFNKMHSQLDSMLAEFSAKEEGYADAIRSNLAIFFIEYIRQSQDPGVEAKTVNPYNQERFEEFSALLDQYFTGQKQVSFYTDLMNLSPYQLNEITKSSIGKTASELINDRIILESKRYLLATSNQVKEIADRLGYEDTSYFIRFFKKHVGHSPEMFRQHFR